MGKKRFAVIFKAKQKKVGNDYIKTAKALRERALEKYNCSEFISINLPNNREMSISYWPTKEKMGAWANDPEHKEAQQKGKKNWYESYEVETIDLRKKEEVGLFFLAFIPPKEIQKEIREWQESIASKYNVRTALKSPPHITIHPPIRWPIKAIGAWKESLNLFATHQNRIKININGFGHFKKDVIFAKIEQEALLMQFQRSFLDYWTNNLGAQKPKHAHSYNPHITLAFRNLDSKSFDLIWERFYEKIYCRRFVAEELSLLQHNDQKWNVVEKLKLL